MRRGSVRCSAVWCGAVRCGAVASRRALLIFSILHLHTSPVVSGNLLCRECQFLVIKSRIQAKNLTFPLRHFELRPQSKDIAAPKNANSRSQKWGQKTYAFSTPTSDLHCKPTQGKPGSQFPAILWREGCQITRCALGPGARITSAFIWRLGDLYDLYDLYRSGLPGWPRRVQERPGRLRERPEAGQGRPETAQKSEQRLSRKFRTRAETGRSGCRLEAGGWWLETGWRARGWRLKA